MPGRYRSRKINGGEPRPGRIKTSVAWLACRRRADAHAIRAHGGTRRQRRARTRFQRCRRYLALAIRYATGRIHRGDRSPLETASAAVSIAACVRAWPTGEKVRREYCFAERSDPRTPPRKYLEPGVEQCVSADGFAEARAKF